MTKRYEFKKQIWPIYLNLIQLMDSVDIWNRLNQKIDRQMTKLLAKQLADVYKEIKRGFATQWKAKDYLDYESKDFYNDFSQAVSKFKVLTEYLLDDMAAIDGIKKELQSCDYQFVSFETLLQKIQKIIDALLLKGFTNISFLVDSINNSVEQILIKRLIGTLGEWRSEFQNYKQKNNNVFVRESITHEIKVKQRSIQIDPPIQESRQF